MREKPERAGEGRGRRRRVGTGLLALLLAVGGCKDAPEEASESGSQAAIPLAALRAESVLVERLEELNARLLGAVRRGDAETAASLYRLDALLLLPSGDVHQERDPIREFWAAPSDLDIEAAETEREGWRIQVDVWTRQ